MTSSTTLRLPDGLKNDAETYAAALGISLNALCSVALRDYLDARRVDLASVSAVAARATPAAVGQKPVSSIVAAPAVYAEPAGGVYAPCPCLSGKKWKFCHGAT
ncbi:SEC-C metal-binding domain-containing protein [Rhodanobacter ginsengisoli]|uniref:SEC-C metal-binding domain-containing protein n=1 Tax=Rhodanobacter ginsengisoli TaxID=418646 RepID=A0ABW0QM86_9GAMM